MALALAGCGKAPETITTLKSPKGDLILTVRKADLGACCDNTILISGKVFGHAVDEVATIDGSSGVGYTWKDSDTLSIIACNARNISFRSGFQNEDYSRRFILTVENERPSEDSDRVVCNGDRFEHMTPL